MVGVWAGWSWRGVGGAEGVGAEVMEVGEGVVMVVVEGEEEEEEEEEEGGDEGG